MIPRTETRTAFFPFNRFRSEDRLQSSEMIVNDRANRTKQKQNYRTNRNHTHTHIYIYIYTHTWRRINALHMTIHTMSAVDPVNTIARLKERTTIVNIL